MDGAIAVADNVFWVGANDRQTDLFEGIWPLPRGVSYNSYLIIDKKVALMDTVKKSSLPALLEHIKSAVGDAGKIDYLVIHHLEPDHSGSVPFLRQVFPEMEIIGNEKTAQFLEHIYGITSGVRIIREGDELELGRRKLKFYMTPMVHWPETMMTYESGDRILFSGDAFGGFGTLDGDIFDDKLDINFYEDEILRYFSNIVGKYAGPVSKAIEKLSGLDIGIVAPTHGPVWRKCPGEIIQRYAKWSRQESQQGVVVAFGSMYGATERMTEAVTAGVRKAGIRNLVVHDVSRSHVSYVIRDAWRYRGLVLGCPTYDTGIFPPMDALVRLLEEKKLSKRVVGLFGSYGWSGGGVKGLRQFVENTKLELVEPVVEARFSATAEQLALCEQLGQNVAEAVLHE
ncbi:MAG: FprA family A-type flavoprotein [Phycisphaerae bacterium]